MLGLRGRTKRRSRSIYVLMAAALGAASSMVMFTGTAGAQTHIVVDSPSGYTHEAGDGFQICVETFDDQGDQEPISSRTLTYSVTPAADTTIPTPFAFDGTNLCSNFQFDTVGVYTVTASVTGVDSSDVDDTDLPVTSGSRVYTITQSEAEVLACTVPASVVAGVPFNFTITALDDFDNITTDVDPNLDITFFVTPEDAANVLPGTTEWPAGKSSVTLSATLWTSGAIIVIPDGDEDLQDIDEDLPLVCPGILVTAAAAPSGGSGGSGSGLPSFTG